MKQDTEMGEVTNGYIGTPGTVPVTHAGNDSAIKRMRTSAILLRITAVALCITALVTMALDRQTHFFTIPVNPPVILAKTAKYSSILSLVVYVYANAVVAGYNLLQALWTIVAKGISTSKCYLWTTFLLDQLVVYALLGIVGAATEVAYLAERGEAKVQWYSQCGNFGKFCSQVGASVIICFTAILTLVALAAISAKQLFSSDRLSRTTRRDGYFPNN